jgi:hypothetical protein
MSRAAVSRPGRKPASVNSFARCADTFFGAGFCAVCALANESASHNANTAHERIGILPSFLYSNLYSKLKAYD